MSDITEDVPGISLWAELKASLGDLTKAVQERNREAAKRAVQPSYNRIQTTGIVPASGFLVLEFDLDGPSMGFFWNVKKLAVGGLTTATVTAGRCDIFAVASDLRTARSLAEIGLAAWQDQATTLPQIATYGEGELRLQYPDKLYAVFSGCTPGQQVIATGTVQNVQESAARQNQAI